MKFRAGGTKPSLVARLSETLAGRLVVVGMAVGAVASATALSALAIFVIARVIQGLGLV